MKNKVLLIGATVLLLVGVFFIGVKFYKADEAERLGFIAQENFKKFVPDYAPRMGATNPEVYVVEFLDPECESCREFYPYVKMLLDDYKDKVQLVVRYAPFHGNSKMVIKILEAARKQGKYWETLTVLFQYQPQWGSHHEPRPELIWNYLPEAGVDIAKIKTDMEDPAIVELINREIADGTELGVRGTPTFFVNGRPLERFSYEALVELVQSSLSKAN